jgi:hypothetical protein
MPRPLPFTPFATHDSLIALSHWKGVVIKLQTKMQPLKCFMNMFSVTYSPLPITVENLVVTGHKADINDDTKYYTLYCVLWFLMLLLQPQSLHRESEDRSQMVRSHRYERKQLRDISRCIITILPWRYWVNPRNPDLPKLRTKYLLNINLDI